MTHAKKKKNTITGEPQNDTDVERQTKILEADTLTARKTCSWRIKNSKSRQRKKTLLGEKKTTTEQKSQN